jgi:hypothetical protein
MLFVAILTSVTTCFLVLSRNTSTINSDRKTHTLTKERNTSTMLSSLPANLKEIVTDDTQRALLEDLCSEELGQSHLLDAYCAQDGGADADADKLRGLCSQLLKLNGGYPGGLRSYIEKAKKLLQDSKDSVNPLDGWSPSIPQGESFELGTDKYHNTENIGMELLSKVGFVLVAGGLGERLGYNGAKVCYVLFLILNCIFIFSTIYRREVNVFTQKIIIYSVVENKIIRLDCPPSPQRVHFTWNTTHRIYLQ